MPDISLIVSCNGRTEELKLLFDSLSNQNGIDIELILVNQNDGEKNKIIELMSFLPKTITSIYLEGDIGASNGRNAGMSKATGEIIAFPDIDCWYPSGLLVTIIKLFKDNSDIDCLLGRHAAPPGNAAQPYAKSYKHQIDLKSVLRGTVVAFAMFFRSYVVKTNGGFNEKMGPNSGTIYQAAEENDYIIRCLLNGFKIVYNPDIFIYHPFKESLEITPGLQRRYYYYGCADGYLLRKHHYSIFLNALWILRPLIKTFALLLTGRFGRARLSWLRTKGRLKGMITYPRTPEYQHSNQ